MIKMRSPKGEIVKVPQGVAEQYKTFGFVEMSAKKSTHDVNKNVEEGTSKDGTNNNAALFELEQKPLSEWTKAEVQSFVKASGRGHELKGKNLEEAKALVKDIMESTNE